VIYCITLTYVTGYNCPVQQVSCTVRHTLPWLISDVSSAQFVSHIEAKGLTSNDFDSFQLSSPLITEHEVS